MKTKRCDKCWEVCKCQEFKTFQPSTQEIETHFLCPNCIYKIVSKWFNKTCSGAW